MTEQDRDIVKQITQQLEDDCRSLDTTTQQRLHHARQQAMAQLDHETGRRRRWLPATALTMSMLAGIVALTVFYSGQNKLPGSGLSDMDLLVESDVELLEELDFLQWYAQQTNGRDTSGTGRAG